MSVQILDLDQGAAVATSWIEIQQDGGGLGSSLRYQLSDILALAGDGDLDAVLVAGNDAAGIGITELAGIDNIINDFVISTHSAENILAFQMVGITIASDFFGAQIVMNEGVEIIAPNNVDFFFGTSLGGILGLDAVADQMNFVSDQFYTTSSDSNMVILMDIDTQYIELTNQSNYLRVTGFDIEVGSPILGYLNASETNAQIQISANSLKFKHDKCVIRTTTALPANTVGGSNTTLTANAVGAFPAIDGVTLSTLFQDVLVCNEATQTKNGAYTLTQVGSAGTPWILTRRVDSNAGGELECAVYNVERGTRFAGTSWKQITQAPTLGTHNIVFMPFGDNIIDDGAGGYWKINASILGVLTTTAV